MARSSTSRATDKSSGSIKSCIRSCSSSAAGRSTIWQKHSLTRVNCPVVSVCTIPTTALAKHAADVLFLVSQLRFDPLSHSDFGAESKTQKRYAAHENNQWHHGIHYGRLRERPTTRQRAPERKA